MTRARATAIVDKLNAEPYTYLQHGEYAAPSYEVHKVRNTEDYCVIRISHYYAGTHNAPPARERLVDEEIMWILDFDF